MLNSSIIELDDNTKRSVAAMMEEAVRRTSYPYPWRELEDKSALRRDGSMLLVVYGSLINSTSAARTLSVEQIRQRKPVIVFGMRRLFNYAIPVGNTTYRISGPEDRSAALNVAMTGDINDMVNGVLTKVSPKEIPVLRHREKHYDLVPVACISWDRPTDWPFVAYTLCCPDHECHGLTPGGEMILPNLAYYNVCREGAAQFGDAFLKFWLATTFLADGSTPVGRWDFGALADGEANKS